MFPRLAKMLSALTLLAAVATGCSSSKPADPGVDSPLNKVDVGTKINPAGVGGQDGAAPVANAGELAPPPEMLKK